MAKSILLFALAAILLAQFGCGATPPENANDDGSRIAENPDPNAETIVYITPEGEKYHREDCPHVAGKAVAISLAEAKVRGYTPCKACHPPE